VDDGIDAVERAADCVAVAHVADDQLDLAVEVVRPPAVRVHLWLQAV
jgi:hypothetical protein